MNSDDESSSRRHTARRRRADLQAQLRVTREDIERQVRDGRERFDQVNERIEARTGRNLFLAIIIGVVLGAGLVASLIFVKVVFVIFATIIVGFTAFELAQALRRTGRFVDPVAAAISAVVIIGTAYFIDAPSRGMVLAGGIAFVVVFRLVAQMASGSTRGVKDIISDLATAAFIQIYVPWLASFAVVLVAQENGEWWTLGFIILVVSVDIGAYVAGLSFGKHAMAPMISPNKTWEGFAGAAACSILVGILLALFMIGQPWWIGVILGLLILGSATVGDLTESMIKRDMGIKDMSSWLPGHGGFLDRLDSILPSAAVMFGVYTVVMH
ncbi:phosphatidate cytidylyltransferase [Microbacterium sp. MPKO10]|uniref:phosphatidate cytidylyltransferase n=1 Tax=Microbacterium sp. MPKO10 TaxID=2989818 RepID=UPI002235FF8F|nr:phosphatidate cytidylyltransferase [Microbacterium sp. MPKO10]MCW4459349.1 phosphatidate cytidylyltransferase [Microbacterium sp. MPKO10]